MQNNMHYITPEDYRNASKYVDNPEEFDFYKILEWDKEEGCGTPVCK